MDLKPCFSSAGSVDRFFRLPEISLVSADMGQLHKRWVDLLSESTLLNKFNFRFKQHDCSSRTQYSLLLLKWHYSIAPISTEASAADKAEAMLTFEKHENKSISGCCFFLFVQRKVLPQKLLLLFILGEKHNTINWLLSGIFSVLFRRIHQFRTMELGENLQLCDLCLYFTADSWYF